MVKSKGRISKWFMVHLALYFKHSLKKSKLFCTRGVKCDTLYKIAY